MRVLVIGAAPVAGSDTLVRTLVDECDYIVAADAAAEWCLGIGVRPDVAVGDFDSALLGAETRLADSGVLVRAYPADKNETDLDLAVGVAREAGATTVVFTACTSARIDHTLAALGTVAASADLQPIVIEPHLNAWIVSSAAHPALGLELPIGTTVSVLALGQARGVTLEGFRYPLQDAVLGPLSSHGVSNVTVDGSVAIRVDSGTLLVMASKDA